MIQKLFGIDGPVIDLLDKAGQLIILSIMWIIGCLPIVTICTSNAALYYSVTKTVRFGHGNPAGEFWKHYKTVFVKGLFTSIIFLSAVALVFVLFRLLGAGSLPVILGIFLGFIYCYLGPVQSRFKINSFKVIKLSFIMSVQNPVVSASTLVIGVLIIVLQATVFPIACLLVIPGLFNFVLSFPLETVLRKYMPEQSTEEQAWIYQS